MAIVKFDRGIYTNGNKVPGIAYGQLERNKTSFDRTGNVEAQCYLSEDEFSTVRVDPLTKYVAATGGTPATKIVSQVGQFLAVDKTNAELYIPSEDTEKEGLPIVLNYSTETIYDERKRERRNFCQTIDLMSNDSFMVRGGFTTVGEVWTTNTVCWDTTTNISGTAKDGTTATLDFSSYTASTDSFDVWKDIKDFINAGPRKTIFACVVDGSDGELCIGADPEDALGKVWCKIVAAYDNADGTCSFMVQTINEPKAEETEPVGP